VSSYDKFIPTEVQGLPGKVKKVALGLSHVCALTETDEVWCWGSNYYHELGNETGVDSPVPVVFQNSPASVTDVYAGTMSGITCVLTTEHTLHCTGANFYGALGNGSSWN
jgi:alpha-tubulin suppressor-like RCC1 family protein